MELTAFFIVAVIVYLLYKANKITDETKCPACGKSNTNKTVLRLDENDIILDKAKGNSINVLYKYQCTSCKHQWNEVKQESISE